MDLEPLKIDRSEPVRGSRRRRRAGWIAPAIALACILGIGWLFRGPLLGFVDDLRLPEVRTLVVRRSSPVSAAAASGTSANGYVVAKTRAALSADTPGRIVALNVEEGTVVKKGDVVARLYADEYAALLRRAEADLDLANKGVERSRAERKVDEDELARLRAAEHSAEADVVRLQSAQSLAEIEFERSKRLVEEQVDTAERLDRAKAGLDSAKASVAWAKAQLETAKRATIQGESRLAVGLVASTEAEARVVVAQAMRDQAAATLDKTFVRAPFDGIVVLKDAEVGEVVSPNVQGGSNARGSVVTMVDFASLEVQAEVPETSLAAAVIGRRATIYLDAFPDGLRGARLAHLADREPLEGDGRGARRVPAPRRQAAPRDGRPRRVRGGGRPAPVPDERRAGEARADRPARGDREVGGENGRVPGRARPRPASRR